jgi:hypothetical protein
MSADLTALATLICAIATLVTAVAGAWIGIASHLNLARRVQVVHNNNVTMNDDINQMKSDVFTLTAAVTQNIAVPKE